MAEKNATQVHRRRVPGWSILRGIVVLAIVLLVVFFRWDWLIPIVQARASAALGHPVTIGHLHVDLGKVTTVTAEDLTVANPQGFPEGTRFATADRLIVAADLWGWLRHRNELTLTRIVLDRPVVNAATGPGGKPNYEIGSGSSGGGMKVNVGDLVINDGVAHVDVPKERARFDAAIQTSEAEGDRPAQIEVKASGTYAGQPIQASFVGDALLTLRNAAHPYHLDSHLQNGPTTVAVAGTVQDPLHFKGADVHLTIAGPNMARLTPLTAIPIPQTPPFRVTGRLNYQPPNIRFDDFAGTLGNSDLEGSVAVNPRQGRPFAQFNLQSRRVDLDDLAGFIGGASTSASEGGVTQAQRAEAARAKAGPSILPDTPIDIPKFRMADVALRYRAASIEGGRHQPLSNLEVTLDMTNGVIRLHPVSFGIGTGTISGNVVLTPIADNETRVVADIDFRRVGIAQLVKATPGFTGAGTIGGRSELNSQGRSLADFLGNGNGDLKLFTEGGDLSELLVALSGLQFGDAVLSALGMPQHTDLRCMVVDMPLAHGVFTAQTFLIDTKSSNIKVSGTVNMKDERLDLEIATKAKHFSIGSLPGPIDIGGTFKDPSVRPAPGPLAARAGAAAVLGALLTPLGALIPTIQLGLGKDTDCGRLVTYEVSTGPARMSPAELHRRLGH